MPLTLSEILLIVAIVVLFSGLYTLIIGIDF